MHVLHLGELIASGSPEEVREAPAMLNADVAEDDAPEAAAKDGKPRAVKTGSAWPRH